MAPKFPGKQYESGKDCILAASRMVKDRVAIGCTFLQPEIIPKVVCTVAAGSFHTWRLYVVLYPDSGRLLGSSLSWALRPSWTSQSHSITCAGCFTASCR